MSRRSARRREQRARTADAIDAGTWSPTSTNVGFPDPAGLRVAIAEDIRRGDRRHPKIQARLGKPQKANLRARNQSQLDVLKNLIEED